MNHKDEQQPTERVTSRRLLGAPPSAAAMRIAGLSFTDGHMI